MTMTIAIIKSDGSAINIDAFSKPKFDIDGFLNEFDLGKDTYKYHQVADFLSADRDIPNLEGYYKESDFLGYIQHFMISNTLSARELVKFNFQPYLAKVGAPVVVSMVNFDAPYELYYKERTYSFNVGKTVGNKGIRKYKKGMYANLDLTGYAIDVPSDAIESENTVDLSTAATGYFFKKNFTDFLDSWSILLTQKSQLKKLSVQIAFKINYIVKNIFPLLIDNDANIRLENEANSYVDNTASLPDLLRVIFLIKKSWGYYYDPATDPQMFHRHNFDTTFSGLPNYDEYFNYFNSLVVFYDSCYKLHDKLLNRTDKEKLGYLVRVLPPGAVSLIPYSIIKDTIAELTRKSSWNTNDEGFLVRLVQSVNSAYANDFLDFLLVQTGTPTLYEVIYRRLNDEVLADILNFSSMSFSFKRNFVYAVYGLWQHSKYNFVDPAFKYGVNPNSYFILNRNDPKIFNKNNTLTFQSSETADGNNVITFTKVTFQSEFKGYQLNISKVTSETLFLSVRTGEGDVSGFVPSPNNVVPLGLFHLYQPLKLIGFKPNLELQLPQKSMFPAFLIQYAQDFDRIADFESGVKLALSLTANMLIAYFTGGISEIIELGYLLEASEIGEALVGPVSATNEVVVWQAISGVGQAISMSAGDLADINQYLTEIENDPEKRAILERNQQMFMMLGILGDGFSSYAATKIVSDAAWIKDEIKNVPGGVPEIGPKHIQLLDDLTAQTPLLTDFLGTKISTLDLQEANNILAKYNTLTQEQKLLFWKDFHNLEDINVWRKLNNDADAYFDNWLALSQKGFAEAASIDFITNSKRVTGLSQIYDKTNLRSQFATLSHEQKIKFVDAFGEADDAFLRRMNQYPGTVSSWAENSGERKLFALQNRVDWLEDEIAQNRLKILYERAPKLYHLLSESQILTNFGENALAIVRKVESKVAEFRNSGLSGNGLGARVLVSGMVDRQTGLMSDTFTNYIIGEETKTGGAYDLWVNGENTMHPLIRERYEQVKGLKKGGAGYNMNNREDVDFAGEFLGAHAEFRALNDLALKRWENIDVDRETFDNWLKNDVLGYNSFLRKPGSQKQCADCFYLTDPVTFIRIEGFYNQ